MKKLSRLEKIRSFFIQHWLKEVITLFFVKPFFELGRDFLLSSNINREEVLIIILSYILLMIIAHQLEKYVIYLRIKDSHYPKSFVVVKNKIIPEYEEKSKSKSYINTNNKRDKIIKSPIDYTYETLSGNEAPIFRPNEKYLEEIFEDDIEYAVSLTSENPNMWLDPTLNFYFVNTLLISLLRKFNSSGKSKLVIRDFSNQNGYDNYINSNTTDLIDKLIINNKPVSYEFIRFFLYNGEQEDCLSETIFPSLKASQDLFRLNSFFINKDKIKSHLTADDYNSYNEGISRVWKKIIDANNIQDKESIDIVNRRIKEEIPEFLILFKSNLAIVHTYVNGIPLRTIVGNTEENAINYYSTLKNMISYLAKYERNKIACKKIDWFPKETEHLLNSKNSFIDWE